MREIKFRAWDTLSKIMYYHGNLENGDVMVLSIEGEIQFSSGDAYQQKDFELMQYTGLKDKNGKEIYDGDLLQIAISSYSTGNVITQKTVPVEYRVCKFGVPWSDEFTALDGFTNTTFEVIGNIYESPELLQQPTG